MAFRSVQLFQVDQALAVGTNGLHHLGLKGGCSIAILKNLGDVLWKNRLDGENA